MARPQNKDEYRQVLAEMFAGVLEEKGLHWQKEWQGKGGHAPHNGITKACYKGTNAFLLSLVYLRLVYLIRRSTRACPQRRMCIPFPANWQRSTTSVSMVSMVLLTVM
jgi:hypothetical protein